MGLYYLLYPIYWGLSQPITGAEPQAQTCAVYMEHSCLNCRPFTIKRMSKGAVVPQGYEPNGGAMERSASVPPNPFWSQRVQAEHKLEEARPEDLPIQDDDGSSDRGMHQNPVSPARGQPVKPSKPAAASAARRGAGGRG